MSSARQGVRVTDLPRAFTRRAIITGLIVSSALVLAAAYAFEHLGGLEPCPLCLYQRYPYFAAIALGIVALAVSEKPWEGLMADGIVMLTGLVFLIGFGVALYHVGVEQGWWQGSAACGIPDGPAATVEELERRLAATPIVRCDEVAWSLFGLSMAGYNALISLGLAAVALAAPWAVEVHPRAFAAGERGAP